MTIASTVPARFREMVQQYPNQVAIIQGRQRVTYAELDALAEGIARRLVAQVGDRPQPIALYLDEDIATIAAMLGVLKAGHFYSVIDPGLPLHRIQSILDNLEAGFLLVDSATEIEASQHMAGMQLLRCDITMPAAVPTELAPSSNPDALTAVYYTSGTTGRPKGVMIYHRMMLQRIRQDALVYAIGPDDVVSMLFSAAYSASTYDIFGALLNGATLSIYSLKEQGIAGLRVWLENERVSYWHIQANVLHQFLMALPAGFHFDHIRYMRPSGKTLTADIRQLQKHLGPEVVIAHSLNSSETGPVCRLVIEPDTVLDSTVLPVGYPVAGVDLMLVDEAGHIVQGEGVGEVLVRSRYLAAGYWGQPELSAQRFQVDPSDPQVRTYRGGDLARRRPDGALEWLGRKDRIVKIRGYTIDLTAVENVLESLPFVREAYVDTYSPENEPSLVAYVCPAGDKGSFDTTRLRDQLAGVIPPYMIPNRFMFLTELPRQQNGKVDRRSLPSPRADRPHLSTSYQAPGSRLETLLAEIWAEILALDEVGIGDDFFELGGDSITAMRMTLVVEESFGYRVSPAFFHQPTVARLAGLISPESTREIGSGQATDFKSVGLGARQRHHSMRRRFARYLLKFGPVWGSHTLPYGTGVRIQRSWIRMPWIKGVLGPQSVMVREWLSIVGRDDSLDDEIELSILANTWGRWRDACMKQPDIVRRWVKVRGFAGLNAELASERPVILVGTHTAIKSTAMKTALHQLTGRSVWTLGFSPNGVVDAVDKVVHARNLLDQGGIVVITGDGAQGTRGVELSFYGRPWLFRSGGAELALDTGAALFPVFTTLDPNGHVTVEFLDPLTSPQGSRQNQVDDLTRQYAALLIARWPSLIGNMKWDKLRQILTYGSSLSTPETQTGV